MVSFIIVSSSKDIASLKIAESLIKKYDLKEGKEKFDSYPIFMKDDIKLVKVKPDLIFSDHLGGISADAYIFVSRHKSESKMPCLTAHFPGNFSHDISYGGRSKELAYTFPSFHKEYIKKLWLMRESVPSYQIVTEPMHHGPTSLPKPVIFVEIGSTEKEWKDTKAAEVVSKALIEVIEAMPKYNKVGIGFGGTHYSRKFTNLLIKSEFALSAIAPKYALPFIDERIFSQMVQKSSQKVGYAFLDKKGLGSEKAKIIELVTKADLELIKI